MIPFRTSPHTWDELRQTLERIRLDQATGPLHNWTAITDPGLSDDETDGYSPGSFWFNTITEHVWLSVDSTTGAAEWEDLTDIGAIGGGLVNYADLSPYERGIVIGERADHEIDESTSIFMTARDGDMRLNDEKKIIFGDDSDVSVEFDTDSSTLHFNMDDQDVYTSWPFDPVFYINSTSNLRIPAGASGYQGSPYEGGIRYNTDSKGIEMVTTREASGSVRWRDMFYRGTEYGGAVMYLLKYDVYTGNRLYPVTQWGLYTATGGIRAHSLYAGNDTELGFSGTHDPDHVHAFVRRYDSVTSSYLQLKFSGVKPSGSTYALRLLALTTLSGPDITDNLAGAEPQLRLYDVGNTRFLGFYADNVTSGDMCYIDSDGFLATTGYTNDDVVTENSTDTLYNKTLITPTIADFTNATHDHEDDAGGGTLTYGEQHYTLLSVGTAESF